MNPIYRLSLILIISIVLTAGTAHAQSESDGEKDEYRLNNPITVEYLQTHLEKQSPRLVLNKERDEVLRQKLEVDPMVQAYFESLKLDASRIMQKPLLEREVYDGMRMLRISNEMVNRLGILGMVYHLNKDQEVLARINEELINVSNYEDWNPSHFLDTGEMALAVALGLDWAGKDLPASTVELAETALIEKGILPSFSDSGYNFWINRNNNWNQVVHGGLVAAAITIAEKDPELAANTISRALDNMHHGLKEYMPDGIYPEGPTYWDYGTMFSVITSSILSSAFGTDFGIADFPGFKESADFRMLAVGPSSEFFNFFDAGSNVLNNNRGRGEQTIGWFNRGNGVVNLTWFAVQTGNSLYFDSSYYTDRGEDNRRSRFDGPAMVWLSQYEPKEYKPLPLSWKGEGDNPLVIFRGGENDPEHNPELFYLGAKGGRASINHGHMDVGSFVFELDGVRWSIDPGMQNYADLEQTGFNLWSNAQDSDRWTLQAYNNFGHSTLTVNNALHKVDGYSQLVDFIDGSNGENPEATFDLTEVFDGHLESASRKFIKEGPRSLIVEDNFRLAESTRMVTWQMVTVADVVPVKGGAVLKQNDKELNLEILSPSDVEVSVIALNPPPIAVDKQIENLKRVEIAVPAWRFNEQKGNINVRLSGK